MTMFFSRPPPPGRPWHAGHPSERLGLQGPDPVVLQRQRASNGGYCTLSCLSNRHHTLCPPFSNVGLKITKLACGGFHVSNPEIITKLLTDRGLSHCNPVCVPYVACADLSVRRLEEAPDDKLALQSAVGTLRFIVDRTHPAISWIKGLLG